MNDPCFPPLRVVSEATLDRYERAQFEYLRAMNEWTAAWLAYTREAYATGEMADPVGMSPETET